LSIIRIAKQRTYCFQFTNMGIVHNKDISRKAENMNNLITT